MDNILNSVSGMVNGDKRTLNTPVSTSSALLIPVIATMNSQGMRIQFSGKTHTVNTEAPIAPQLLTKAYSFLLNIVQQKTVATNATQMQLLTIGQSIYFPLPKAMLALANRNNISERKLLNLGRKAEGYLLPNANNQGTELQFNNGPNLTLSMLASLADGEYSVAIKTKEQQLFLKLSPIQAKIPISFNEQLNHNNIKEDVHTLPQSVTQTGKAKTNVNYEYSQLFKQLENTSMPTPFTPSPSEPQYSATSLDSNHHKNQTALMPKNNRYLASAFAKAGGLPRASIKHSAPLTSLASSLFKLLPKLNPESMPILSEPKKLQQALFSLTRLNVDPSTWNTAPTSHISSISLLYQLMLGHAATNQELSPALQDRLSLLQAQLGLSPQLLSLLEATSTHTSLASLLNNLNLYQQQSGTLDGVNHWYFALPYSINHYQEQFEGHFEQVAEQSKHSDKWILRLKFNLSSGPLLITTTAYTAENTDHPLHLSVNFTSDSETLLSKVKLLSPSLTSKVEQLGISISKVSTHKQPVPATLLPGEHYLVKVKV